MRNGSKDETKAREQAIAIRAELLPRHSDNQLIRGCKEAGRPVN